MSTSTERINEQEPASENGPAPASPDAESRRQLEAEAIVHRNVLWAFSAGILPVPMFDIVAITGVQLKLIKELSELYGLEFREGMAKKAATSLIVGVGGVGLGGAIGASLFKFVPIVGYALGVASIPVIAGALTHAVGKAFIMHFEAGGTLLDFDPKAMRNFFEAEFAKAKVHVAKFEHQAKSNTNGANGAKGAGAEVDVTPTETEAAAPEAAPKAP